MKKIIIAFFAAVLFAALSHASEFTVMGFVYNYNGVSGTASTPNSFAYLYAYRLGVAGQIGLHAGGEEIPPCVSPNKIYASDGSTAAYFSFDIGSSDWDVAPVPLSAGQVGRVVLEVSATGNCYAGPESYVGCVDKTILASEMPVTGSGGMTYPDCSIRLLPSPDIDSQEAGYIRISWTGIDLDNIESYNIYRDVDSDGNYALIANVAQNRGNQIIYTDNDAALAQGKNYTYKISVRFIWGGGNGAPNYYETFVKSKKSLPAYLLPPTCTVTPTGTAVINSPTCTQTVTQTLTYTDTATLTATPTYTQTSTDTFTTTYTATGTITQTMTYTLTLTVTATPSITKTSTATATPLATLTATIVPALVREGVMVYNNPVRDSRVKLAFMATEAGQAELDFYNINAELVKRYKVSAVKGSNDFEADFHGIAPGVYVVRINVSGRNLPGRKIAIIK